MATNEVTGKTAEEIEQMREEHSRLVPFDDNYCLSKIPRQPDDYDGPRRFCVSRCVKRNGRCKHHGGCVVPRLENLDKLGNLKHGMYATDEHLKQTMSDREEELYEWVLSWPEVYEIDLESDPSTAHDFQTLAVEIVREARGKDYILSNGEITERGVYLPDGQQIDTEEIPNSLSETMASQVRLIQKIKTSLGITRKQQMKDDQTQSAHEIMDGIVDVMGGLVNENDGYDPDSFDDE